MSHTKKTWWIVRANLGAVHMLGTFQPGRQVQVPAHHFWHTMGRPAARPSSTRDTGVHFRVMANDAHNQLISRRTLRNSTNGFITGTTTRATAIDRRRDDMSLASVLTAEREQRADDRTQHRTHFPKVEDHGLRIVDGDLVTTAAARGTHIRSRKRCPMPTRLVGCAHVTAIRASLSSHQDWTITASTFFLQFVGSTVRKLKRPT